MNQSKPNILFFPFNLLSHYLRCLELAKQYKDTHNILFKSSVKYNSFIEKEGYGTFDCSDFDAEYVLNNIRKFSFKWLNKKDIKLILLDQIECIKKLQPDVVVADMSPSLKMASEITNTKI